MVIILLIITNTCVPSHMKSRESRAVSFTVFFFFLILFSQFLCLNTRPVSPYQVALLASWLVASRPRPYIFCLVAHQSKIACQAEVSVSWQDAPVTFQLERASVLQPSGQISENRSSRAELSAIRKASLYQTPNAPLTLTSGTAGGSVRAAKGRLCDGTKWCSVGHGQTVCTLLASKGKRHWHWLIFLTLLNMKRGVGWGGTEWRAFGSPIRWATPVVCTEHGPLKCTLTFIRISLTPIMGEPERLAEESTVSSDLSLPPTSKISWIGSCEWNHSSLKDRSWSRKVIK